jgi:hypothetical protein
MKKYYVAYAYENMASRNTSVAWKFIERDTDPRTEEGMRQLMKELRTCNTGVVAIMSIIELA